MADTSEIQDNSSEEKPIDEKKSQVSSADDNKVKLEDLKVCDIKNELEKRELDKNGVKTVLIERLKAAIVEEGENPEEYKFQINLDTVSVENISIEVKVNVPETNGTVLVNDEMNNSEEKQEVALQLSLDEEEAQLNEESLAEITKHTEVESTKEECVEPLNSDILEKEKSPLLDKQSTTQKNLKVQPENVKEKKISKILEQSKIGDNTLAISPKILKVIGKSDKLKSSNILAKSLWVTGLPNTTRAADLTALFSKQGKVLSVKIVKSAKQTPAKCYGIVTMGTSKDATKAIQNLHRTELNERIISVERKQGETATMLKKSETKTFLSTAKKGTKKHIVAPKQVSNAKDSVSAKCKETPKVDSKDEEKKLSNDESNKKSAEKVLSEKSKDKERKSKLNREHVAHRSSKRPMSFKPRHFGYNERPRFDNFRRPFNRRPLNNHFSYYSSFKPRSSFMNFQKLREERFQREKLRERRDSERRRENELIRHRYIERKQREEAYRLEREKEKLRIERELLERERAEIIKLEREKQRLEREQLECEREELRRQTEFRRSSKRPFSRVDRNPDLIWEERKKSRYDIRSNFRGEASGSSRYELASRERVKFSREYERHPEKYSSQKHIDVISRSDLGDRDARREITIRPREDRQVFSRGNFRDNRRSLPSRERERHSSSRSDWKQDRRVQEREISSNSASGQRRMTYY